MATKQIKPSNVSEAKSTDLREVIRKGSFPWESVQKLMKAASGQTVEVEIETEQGMKTVRVTAR